MAFLKNLEKRRESGEMRNLKASDVGTMRGMGVEKRELERAQKRYDKQVAESVEHSAEETHRAEAKFQRAIDATMDAIARELADKKIVLDPSQLRALQGMLKNRVACLIGPAGSGKTTLERMFIKILIQQLQKENIEVVVANADHDPYGENPSDDDGETRSISGIAVAAYTGRAAQQSRRAIGDELNIPIQTIHSLLGYAPVVEEYQAWDEISRKYYTKERRVFRPSFGKALKLPYKVYILDEASMIPIPLYNELVDAMPEGSRVYMVGDIHQLPPVYGKSVFGYAMQKWPTFELEKIHRQAENSPIIANAHRILNGQWLAKADNFTLLPSQASGAIEFALHVRQMVKILADKKRFDPYRDVIIVANSDEEIPTSAPALNKHFVTMFNPEKKVDGIIVNKRMHIHTGTDDKFFAIGDKVMMNANINSVNPPITNGMMGIVETLVLNGKYDQARSQVIEATNGDEEDGDIPEVAIDDGAFTSFMSLTPSKEKADEEDESMEQRQASHMMTIKFETGQTYVCSTAGDFRKVTYGYAITCHKSQGGEYPNTIIAIHSANGALLTQEWLYTAVTRAKENVYLIHNKPGLERALRNQKIKGKTLKDKIKSYIMETRSSDMDLAANPWNVDRTKFPILFNPQEIEK